MQSEASLNRVIHPHDQMVDRSYVQAYFDIGESAIQGIKTCIGDRIPRTILDLPCGHGRVLRHLRHTYPDADITVCDINVEAMTFCAETFGAEPVYTSRDPSEIQAGTYDLIWCGSLFTHFDAPAWKPWLDFFDNHLERDGALIFTTHGRFYAAGHAPRHMPPDFTPMQEQYAQTGFAFDSEHNVSLSSPAWVMRQLERRSRDVMLIERGWYGYQDLWALGPLLDALRPPS